ncbi:MAG: dihydroneopterin aldolase [Campylobacterota bacterium]|nr:dihydroneopterin aldolase [Campylobacterota bacterium]
MIVEIDGLKFQTIIGVLDFERVTPQDVIIYCKFEYAYRGTFINYVDVRDLIKADMIENKYELIEDALISITNKMKKKFISIKSVDLKIVKPSILDDCDVSVSKNTNFKL